MSLSRPALSAYSTFLSQGIDPGPVAVSCRQELRS
jgi:hypothetical protein